MKALKKRWKIWLAAGVVLAALAVWALWTGLTVRTYTLETAKLTQPVRLLLLTDLHSTIHGSEQQPLINLVRAQAPDAILLAGDIADDEVPHRGTELLLEAVAGEYPCFYVTGNHEFWAEDTAEILALLRRHGVTVLAGTWSDLTVRGQTLRLFGVDDPEVDKTAPGAPGAWLTQWEVCRAGLEEGTFSILLSHRPELTDLYRSSGFDLIVSGHAHGGQVRIPLLLNGLYAPNQGFFPRYAGGLYDLDGTSLVVSRGLSISRLPRVFNPPEVVVIDLLPGA